MRLLRYLKEITLLKSEKVKQLNGTYVNQYTEIGNYKVQLKRLTDEVDASIYGSDINKMYQIATAKQDLENLLIPKISNESDNISFYYILYKDNKYKIESATEEGIKIKLI